MNKAVFDRIASVCGGESICRNLAEALCWLAGNHFQHDELDSDGKGGTKFNVCRSVFTNFLFLSTPLMKNSMNPVCNMKNARTLQTWSLALANPLLS